MAVVGFVEFMFSRVHQFSLVFSFKFAIGYDWPGLVHWPVLNRSLFLAIVHLSVSSAPIRIKIVSIWVQVVPGSKVSLLHHLSLVVRSIGTICFVREAHWVFIECCNWHHFVMSTVVRVLVLN